MRTFILGEFNEQTFKEINKWLDGFKDDDRLGQIYINSGGGSSWVEHSILDRLHRLIDKGFEITLRAVCICSAGFNLFYNYEGSKDIEYAADGIVHLGGTKLVVSGNGKTIVTDDKITRLRFKDAAELERKEYDFLTHEELERFNEGEDIYLGYKRLLKIFNKSNSRGIIRDQVLNSEELPF